MIGEFKVYWGEIASGGIVLSITVMIVSLILQKHIVKGLTLDVITLEDK